MSRFFNSRLKDLEPYVPGEQPKNMGNLIKLNTNENPFEPSKAVIEAVNKAEVKKLKLYSDPTCNALIKAISEYYGVAEEQILTGNGSDEVLAFCFRAFCENGAVFADITYGFYKVFAEMFEVKTEIVPLREDFSIAVEDYEGKKGTVFIANPNAPTGICLSLEKIEELLNQNRNRLVIVDEAYVDFGGETAIPLLKEYDNLIVVQTFSKSRSLAGARLGFAISNSELSAELNTMKYSFNPYNINRLSILAGEAAIKDREYFEKCCETIKENREYTVSKLKEMGFNILESKANFIFVKNSRFSDAEEYYLALREKGILVRYFNIPRIKDFVRITIGSKEQMDMLINATAEILKGV